VRSPLLGVEGRFWVLVLELVGYMSERGTCGKAEGPVVDEDLCPGADGHPTIAFSNGGVVEDEFLR